jgi:hypothetical protein
LSSGRESQPLEPRASARKGRKRARPLTKSVEHGRPDKAQIRHAGLVCHMPGGMKMEHDLTTLRAEALPIQAILTNVLFELNMLDPILAEAIARGFETAANQIEGSGSAPPNGLRRNRSSKHSAVSRICGPQRSAGHDKPVRPRSRRQHDPGFGRASA